MALLIEPVAGLSLPCLRLSGRIDTTTAPEFQKAIETLLANAAVTKMALDMAKVPYVSSAGLRVLLVAVKTLKPRGGTLTLCGVGAEVEQVLKLSGFQAFLKMAKTPEEAAGA